MIVCGHGDVHKFCKKYDMVVATTFGGDIESYSGVCPVLVTDQGMSINEYLYLKKKLLLSGVELISTEHTDEEYISKHLVYEVEREIVGRKKFVGRCKFGERRVDGKLVRVEEEMKVVRRIIALRDKGYSYQKISDDDGVYDSSGRKFGLSTISLIIKNREYYGL